MLRIVSPVVKSIKYNKLWKHIWLDMFETNMIQPLPIDSKMGLQNVLFYRLYHREREKEEINVMMVKCVDYRFIYVLSDHDFIFWKTYWC
jgi:hypothetical protein